MSRPDDPLPPEVLAALRTGRKLDAVKLLRKATGLGLQEAKDRVEAHPFAGHTPVPPPGPAHGGLPAAALAALQQGHKIEAIRLVREATGLGLKEAKDTVDAAQAASARGLSPGEVPRWGGGVWAVVVVVVLVLLAWWLLRRT